MRYVTQNMKRVFLHVAILGLSMGYVFTTLTRGSREQRPTAVQIGNRIHITLLDRTLLDRSCRKSRDNFLLKEDCQNDQWKRTGDHARCNESPRNLVNESTTERGYGDSYGSGIVRVEEGQSEHVFIP